jgi:polyphosphate kinase 2 (PPK2 family)
MTGKELRDAAKLRRRAARRAWQPRLAGRPRQIPGDPRLERKRADAERQTTSSSSACWPTLQERLWAEDRRAVLVVLQGIDASGKDGTISG